MSYLTPTARKFQSTLPRRERPRPGRRPAVQRHFNPRSREGSDDQNQLHCRRVWRHFNPRSREGSDGALAERRRFTLAFQSTLPRRERLKQYKKIATYMKFQSTLPRRERRRPSSGRPPPRRISIHAPAKGATLPDPVPRVTDEISIHAPAKGATEFAAYEERYKAFQSTLPRRERRFNYM